MQRTSIKYRQVLRDAKCSVCGRPILRNSERVISLYYHNTFICDQCLDNVIETRISTKQYLKH